MYRVRFHKKGDDNRFFVYVGSISSLVSDIEDLTALIDTGAGSSIFPAALWHNPNEDYPERDGFYKGVGTFANSESAEIVEYHYGEIKIFIADRTKGNVERIKSSIFNIRATLLHADSFEMKISGNNVRRTISPILGVRDFLEKYRAVFNGDEQESYIMVP